MRLRSCRRSLAAPRFSLSALVRNPGLLGLAGLLSLASPLGMAGCGGDRYIVIGTPRAPSAAGFVEVNGKTEDSTRVTVRLEYLHPVDSLGPSLHAYVVWFENGLVAPVRAGTLNYEPDKRVGELKATSPYRKFVVKVTAEANDKVSAPSDLVVASQDISTVD